LYLRELCLKDRDYGTLLVTSYTVMLERVQVQHTGDDAHELLLNLFGGKHKFSD